MGEVTSLDRDLDKPGIWLGLLRASGFSAWGPGWMVLGLGLITQGSACWDKASAWALSQKRSPGIFLRYHSSVDKNSDESSVVDTK